MILHCILFDRESFKDQKYIPTEFEYTLTKRQIKDIFNTEWYELNPFDFLCYDQVHEEYDYLKLNLNNHLIYSGNVLDTHELQCKLKHLTRVDSNLSK